MKKRFLIYAYYDIEGIVRNSTVRLLAEFREFVDYIFFVSNGKISNMYAIEPYVDKVIERDNVGYDAGAYGAALKEASCKTFFFGIDEIIFCNSSFWGPFITLKYLFSKMEGRGADFWGLAYSGKNFSHHLQSYFMVFEKRIVKSRLLNQYFEYYISEKSLDYNEVCKDYEIGLSDFLLSKGFICDAYTNEVRFDLYTNPYGSVKYDRLPIIKKKIFTREFFREDQVKSTLALVKAEYGVDIDEIRNEAKEMYGIELPDEFPKKNILVNSEINQNVMLKSWEEIRAYINAKESIYILGCGYIMHQVLNHFFSGVNHEKLKGIINIGKINGFTKPELKSLLRDYENCSVLICVDEEEVEASYESLELEDCYNVWKAHEKYLANTVYTWDSIVSAMGKYFYYRAPLAVIDQDGYYCGMLTENEMERKYTLSEDTTVLAIVNVSVEGFTDICSAKEFARASNGVAPLVDGKGKFVKFVI